MNIKFAQKGILSALGFIAISAVSVSAFAQSTEYRRGYDQGFRDGVEAHTQQGQQNEQGGRRGRIQIEEATYGARGATCDATAKVQEAVRGRRTGSVTANNELCGDPAKGVAKQLRITYRCGGNNEPLRARSPEGRAVTLNCR